MVTHFDNRINEVHVMPVFVYALLAVVAAVALAAGFGVDYLLLQRR